MSLVITPSNVLFISCHRKFHVLVAQRQAYQEKRATAPMLRFSTGLHAVLREVFSPSRGVPPHLTDLDAFVHFAFAPLHYRDEQERACDRERARSLVIQYASQDEDGPYTLAVEKSIRTSTKTESGLHYSLSARLDRVILRPSRPETLIVRDYKLSRRTSLDPMQVFIYLALAKAEYADRANEFVLEVEAIHEEEGVQRTTYSSKFLRGVIYDLNRKIREYAIADTYPAQPGSECQFCDLRQTCQPDRHIEASKLDF